MIQKDLSQFNILLVDDAPIILELMKNMFIDLGYLGVVTATNGFEALQKIQEQTFDLIVCDWEMPVMTGLQVLEKVRNDEESEGENRQVPFLMVTGMNDIKKVREAIKLKVTDYIIKPFKPNDLKERLVKYLSGH